MDHGAGVAVPVADKGVDHEVAEHLVDIHRRGRVRAAESPQGLDEAVPAGGGHVSLGVVEDVRVAVRVVAAVLELHVAAPHAAGPARGGIFVFRSLSGRRAGSVLRRALGVLGELLGV